MTDGNKANITLVSGVEGFSVYLNGTRIAGNKPWGGGDVLGEWEVDKAEIAKLLDMEVEAK